jgi:hypothetical protein
MSYEPHRRNARSLMKYSGCSQGLYSCLAIADLSGYSGVRFTSHFIGAAHLPNMQHAPFTQAMVILHCARMFFGTCSYKNAEPIRGGLCTGVSIVRVT